MNESKLSDAASDAASTAREDRAEAPNSSMLPGAEKALSALKSAVQGAHATIDRLANGVAASLDGVRARTAQWRDIRDAWTEGVRETVGSNPKSLPCPD